MLRYNVECRPPWPIHQETLMSSTQAGLWNTDGKWNGMTITQKVAFVGKLTLALCTFGFVFPHILD